MHHPRFGLSPAISNILSLPLFFRHRPFSPRLSLASFLSLVCTLEPPFVAVVVGERPLGGPALPRKSTHSSDLQKGPDCLETGDIFLTFHPDRVARPLSAGHRWMLC